MASTDWPIDNLSSNITSVARDSMDLISSLSSNITSVARDSMDVDFFFNSIDSFSSGGGSNQQSFKMFGLRISNGHGDHWLADSVDTTGTQSHFPGDINVATIRQE